MQIDTTAGFCCLDDFCKIYEEWERAGRIGVDGSRQRDHMLSLSERLLIKTMFHNSANTTMSMASNTNMPRCLAERLAMHGLSC